MHDLSGKVFHIYCDRLIDYEAADRCSKYIDRGIEYIFLVNAEAKEGYSERVLGLLATKGKHCSLTTHFRRESSKNEGWYLSNTYLTVLKPE